MFRETKGARLTLSYSHWYSNPLAAPLFSICGTCGSFSMAVVSNDKSIKCFWSSPRRQGCCVSPPDALTWVQWTRTNEKSRKSRPWEVIGCAGRAGYMQLNIMVYWQCTIV